MSSLIENIGKLLIISYQWFWPNTKQYFKHIDSIMMGILQKNRTHHYQYFFNIFSMSWIRYLLIYILPLSDQYRIVLFDSKWSNYLRKRIRKHIVRRNLEICMTGSFLFYTPLYIVEQVMINWSEFFDSDYPHFFGYLKIISALTTLTLTIMDGFFAFHMVELLFTFILCFYWLISIEYDRINQKIHKKQPSNRLLALFIRENTHLFIFVNRIFRSYSTIFLVYLASFLPANLYLVSCLMRILDKELEADIKQLLFTLTWIASHCVGMFGIHYVCTQYSNCIHSNGIKRLIHFNTVKSFVKTKSINLHWKLSFEIEKFHTKNHYGFSYGKFGMISMAGLVRFSLIYCKLLMMVYKQKNKH
ncbi:uncharacterized protein LOC113793821 [Dermatophagoides pteronyssinus]|uniref:uncharacterized protein LOC113793821 n=1 Tax=Dermatophagoides pteronyssinus TaxID=6956 RepID=UPI003F662872